MNAETPTTIRTLLAAGFTITSSERHPNGIEIDCTRPDVLGLPIEYRVALFDHLPQGIELAHLRTAATEDRRALVVIADCEGPDCFTWSEFLAALGGAVPNWRALAPDFAATLLTLAANQATAADEAEPWAAFEEATADAFEFLLGARVNRLGGKKRGKKVSDLLTHTPAPSSKALVIDTKAYKDPFDAASGSLRALEEYTTRQRHRQGNDSLPVGGAVLIANDFKQDVASLAGITAEFIAAVGTPVTFVRARTLAHAVSELSRDVTLRRAIRWTHMFCRGGLLEDSIVDRELADAALERRRT